MLYSIKPFFEGIDTAYSLMQCKVEEDVQRLNHRILMPAAIQTLEVFTAFNHVEKIFETLNTLPFQSFGVIRNVCLVIPSVLTFAVNRISKESHPLIRPAICLIHDHIGTLSHLATIVSSVALIVFGNITLGVTTIAVLGIGFLCRSRIIPYSIRNYLDQSSFLISNIACLVLGGAVEKTLAVAEITLNLINLLKDWMQEKKLKCVVEQLNDQTAAVPANITLSLKNVEVNPQHQLYAEYYIPDPPEGVELIQLSQFAKKIDWKNYAEILKKTCEKNEHILAYKKRQHPLEHKISMIEKVFHTCVDTIQKGNGLVDSYEWIFHDGIEKLIDAVQNHRFQGTEPKDYEPVEKKLKHLIAHLQDLDEDKKVKILMQLALSTYSYSGETIWAIDELYAELQSKTSLKQHVYYRLQIARDEIFNEVIQDIFDLKKNYSFLEKWRLLNHLTTFAQDFYHLEDKHTLYYYMNLLARNYGLTHALGARSDQMVMSDAIYEFPIYLWHYSSAQKILNRNNPELILKTAKEALQSKHFESEVKTTFSTSNSEESINDVSAINDDKIIAYLIALGVFTSKEV